MLSAVVLYEASAAVDVEPVECLVRSLASLVRANVEGLVRDVRIAGPRGAGLDIVADHAGCGLIEADEKTERMRAAISAAHGPHLLLLRAGFAPQQGFIEEAGDFLQVDRAGTAFLRAVPERLLERLFPRAAPLAGLIAPRERCLRALAGDLSALAVAVAPAITLRTPARRVA
ncbi:transposase [Methylocella sp.]|uniref:transposase n=1 Tax=Methylocella sp. TaxID=1978226 RepID=UPI0037835FC5